MKVFGANWKTSVGGYVETICAITIAICLLPAEIWTNPRIWLPSVLLIIAKTVKDTFTKDKNVVGGSIQQDLSGATVREDVQSTLVQATKNATPKENQ